MKKVNSINLEKFKSVFVSISFLTSIDAKNMSKNALLASVIKKGNNTHKTEKEINRKLALMYDSSIDILTEKYKDYISFKVQFEYINVESITKIPEQEIIDFLLDYILNVKIKNGAFDEEIVKRESQTLIERIDEEKDNKRKYALKKLDELIFENEAYSCSVLGDKEDIIKLNGKELFKYYISLMKDSCIVVNVAGNLNGYENIGDNIYNALLKQLDRENEKDIFYTEEEYIKKSDIKEGIEKQEISQSVLAIGVRIEDVTQKDAYKIMVYNQILGGNPASLMFQNVREKESLAYFAKSMYNRQRKAISIFAGIEPNKLEKAKALILKQLDMIKEGEFTTTQFEASKDTLISAYNECLDIKEELSKLMFTNEMYVGRQISVQEMIEEIKKVTRQDVLDIASKVKVDSIFCLGGVENND